MPYELTITVSIDSVTCRSTQYDVTRVSDDRPMPELKRGRPADSAHYGRDLKCRIMKKINNAMTDENYP